MSNNTEHKIAKLICRIIVILGFPFYMIGVVCYAYWLLTRKMDYKIFYLEPTTVGDLYKIRELANAGDKEADDLLKKASIFIAAHVFAVFYGNWICETLGLPEILGLDD